MRRTLASRIITGLFIIAVGVLVLGHVAFGWPVGNLARSWWTLFIIVPGVAGIAAEGFRFWNVFLVLLGAWLLALSQGWLHLAWPYFFGAALILLGIYVIAGGRVHHHAYHGDYTSGRNFNDDSEGHPDYISIFSTLNYANKSKVFRGGKATAVFGTLTVDLGEIAVTSNAVFEVAGVFGTVRVIAPKNTPVRVDVVPVFGMFYNDAHYITPTDGQPHLEIRGAAVFGSVHIV